MVLSGQEVMSGILSVGKPELHKLSHYSGVRCQHFFLFFLIFFYIASLWSVNNADTSG